MRRAVKLAAAVGFVAAFLGTGNAAAKPAPSPVGGGTDTPGCYAKTSVTGRHKLDFETYCPASPQPGIYEMTFNGVTGNKKIRRSGHTPATPGQVVTGWLTVARRPCGFRGTFEYSGGICPPGAEVCPAIAVLGFTHSKKPSGC
jgi:hypothetical protein